MPCFHPVTAWYRMAKTRRGKRQIQFTPNGAFGSPLKIPCGKCFGCVEVKAGELATRLTHERRYHDEACFLTLTYSPEHLPPDGPLNREDAVRFLDTVRQHCRRLDPPRRLRYFLVGEYGGTTGRAHFHCILFGFDFRDDRRARGKRGEHLIYTSETLDRLWGLGHCEIGSAEPGAMVYVARYLTGKADAPFREKGREPEFKMQSQGLGRKFVEEFAGTPSLTQDNIVVLTPQGAVKRKIPRYYDKLMDPEYIARQKIKRRIAAGKQWRDNTPQRLADREEFQRRKVATFKKRGTLDV